MAEALLATPSRSPQGSIAPCAIVVPVYNGFAHLRGCLEALERHTAPQHALWLVDDASPDPRVLPLLREFAARRPGTHVVELEANLGFAGAVNEALARAAGDVVVLNADARVTSGWIEAMQRCRASDPAIGIVCPLSNNATLLTVPALGPLLGDDADAIGACVRTASTRSYPRIPTAVGFCMLLTRELLGAAGRLDPAYGRGYGEENDLSMRALDLGFEIACCDDAYVHHAGEASFGEVDGIDSARERNRRLLERRWPAYAPGVSRWMRANPLRPALERVNAACERARMPGRPRVLHVLHGFESRGGVEEHTRAIIEALRNDVAFNVAVPTGTRGAWIDFTQERPATHLRISRLNPDLVTPGVQVLEFAASVRDEPVERAFRGLLAGEFDVVHFHSPLAWNTMQLPRLAREAGSRVVLSVHDMAWMCAEYNMLTGSDERPCGRSAARAEDAGCGACLRGKSFAHVPGAASGISEFIEERYEAAARAVAGADAIVCPSRFVASRIGQAFGAEAARNVRVIAHGVHDMAPIYRAHDGPTLTVAFVGRFSFRKGAHHFIEAAQRLQGQRIVFEAWGPFDSRLRDAAVEAGVALRGPYAVADLAEHLRAVDLGVIPSTLEETFCLTLSEMHALGIPVAASRSGAIGERIRDGDNGFLFEIGDIDAIVALLLRLRDDRALLARVAARIAVERPATTRQNAAAYLSLYRELAARRSTAAAVRTADPDTRAASRYLGFPRLRERTPLGTDGYDRWIARAPSTAAAGAATDCTWIVLPGAGHSRVTVDSLAAHGVARDRIVELSHARDDGSALRELNRAIASETAEWVVLVQAGDAVCANAGNVLERALSGDSRAALAYADHDAVSIRGERYDPALKPAFDAELLAHQPYIAGLCALRRSQCLAMGGLRAPGWAGVVDHAFRLAALDDPSLVAHIPELLVHRLDLNLTELDGAAFRRALHEIVTRMFRARGENPVRLAAAADAPAMWLHGAQGFGRIAVFLRCEDAPADAAAGLDALMVRAGARVAEIFLDLDDASAQPLRDLLERGGSAAPVVPLGRDPGALAAAFERASCEWIAVVDVRCREFAPGWLERLEQGVTGRFTVAIAPDLVRDGGGRIPGAYVLGAGELSVAAPMPAGSGNDALNDIYASPRAVSCVSPHLSLWRRGAVIEPGLLREMTRAGRFGLAHACLVLGERGQDMLWRPFVAARIALPPGGHAAQERAKARWMRERWGARLEQDPRFHQALGLTAARLEPANRFGPVREGVVRVCAFPFDRWGSGTMRVLQPCAALERAGWADVAMMETHESGRAPNALEWKRLAPDTLLAHNFFHDYQIAALEEYARDGRVLRVLGMDDLLTQLPPGNPYAATIYPDVARRIAHAVSRCDRLVVSTEPLAEAYGKGIHVHVIPNAIDTAAWEGIANAPRNGPRVRVGWAGARQHLEDLKLLERVVEATAGEVDWIFLGMATPALRRHAAECHDMVAVRDYPARLASLGLDVAVAPLQDNPFNRAKSWLKVLEYGMLSIPVVASDVGPYRATPAWLARNDAEWVDAIRALARDLPAARARGAALHDWVLTNATLTRMLPLWRRALVREG